MVVWLIWWWCGCIYWVLIGFCMLYCSAVVIRWWCGSIYWVLIGVCMLYCSAVVIRWWCGCIYWVLIGVCMLHCSAVDWVVGMRSWLCDVTVRMERKKKFKIETSLYLTLMLLPLQCFYFLRYKTASTWPWLVATCCCINMNDITSYTAVSTVHNGSLQSVLQTHKRMHDIKQKVIKLTTCEVSEDYRTVFSVSIEQCLVLV